MSVFLHIMPVCACYLEYATPILSLNWATWKDVLPSRGQGVGVGRTRGHRAMAAQVGTP